MRSVVTVDEMLNQRSHLVNQMATILTIVNWFIFLVTKNYMNNLAIFPLVTIVNQVFFGGLSKS